MLESRVGAVYSCLLVMVILMTLVTTRNTVSKTLPSVVLIGPCEPLETYRKFARDVKGGEAVNCSSAEDCLRRAQKVLHEPFGKQLAQQAIQRAITLEYANAEDRRPPSPYLRADEDNVGHTSIENLCRAEAFCRASISLAPNNPEAFLLLGWILNCEVYRLFRSDDSAVEAIKKAIDLKPAWAEAYCELAHAFDLLRRYEEAVEAYSVEATLRHESVSDEGQIGEPVLSNKKAHEARDAFVVAQIFTKLGRHDKALASLQLAERINPKDDVIHFWTGKTLLSLGDIGAARFEQERLVELCKSKDKFFVTQCEGYAKNLLEEIQQRSK